MPSGKQEKFGILPSLELMPFFERAFLQAVAVEFVARASYGSIAREMLVGNLVGGVLPWEVFVSEVLALPGQRNQWTAAFFSDPYPTELILQTHIQKALCQDPASPARKIPARLQIGIESRSSLTRHQFTEWLNTLELSPRPEIVFKFLPMDQRLQGMPAQALDGFIARSPWGVIAEEQKLGSIVREFPTKGISQRLVTVCRKDIGACERFCNESALGKLVEARGTISDPANFEDAAMRMGGSGKPHIPLDFLKKAARTHGHPAPARDVRADVAEVTRELLYLHKLSMLPPQVSPTEQTARLISPAS